MVSICFFISKDPSFLYLVGGFEHFAFSIIYGIILPIDGLIFFKMVIAPPTSHLLDWSKTIKNSGLPLILPKNPWHTFHEFDVHYRQGLLSILSFKPPTEFDVKTMVSFHEFLKKVPKWSNIFDVVFVFMYFYIKKIGVQFPKVSSPQNHQTTYLGPRPSSRTSHRNWAAAVVFSHCPKRFWWCCFSMAASAGEIMGQTLAVEDSEVRSFGKDKELWVLTTRWGPLDS